MRSPRFLADRYTAGGVRVFGREGDGRLRKYEAICIVHEYLVSMIWTDRALLVVLLLSCTKPDYLGTSS
jgi:hypothetical protein